MPAVIRGAPKGARGGARARSRPKPAAYSPAKLGGASAVGLDPRVAVWATAGIIGAAVLLSLVVGGG
ncbi:hypothetical protein ACNJUT_22565, partial [Mycobacterium tuberculosis]